jgi:fluoroquinolone resistance protein
MQAILDKTFLKEDYTANALPKGEYDNCTFTDCNFLNANLNNIVFTECIFEGCNLTMVQVKQAALKDVRFVNCKITGVHFHDCDPFLLKVQFEKCILQLASFYKLKLKNTLFSKCDLRETDFTETDLTGASLSGCDLANTIFQDTILEKADLRTAFNYSIDPEANRLKGAKFSREGIAGLLDKYQIVIE